MSMYGYSGSNYDRNVEDTNKSTIHKMKETYWTTKQAVIKKLGKKEDEHVVASDAQLDAKLEVFKAIQKSSMDLLRVIEKYQDRLCVVSQEENTMGRLLKAHSNKDKTRAGKMMAAVGKAESNSAQERLALHNPLRRLYQEVETFRYRAVSDTLVTINRMEGARTEYRGALLWMRNISEELDPDMYKQLEKFRKVQAQVRKTKQRFDKLKLDVMQKVDLLAASRCNMFSHVLANYQTMLLHYWEKTSRTMSAVAESFKGYQYYEFNMLRELTEVNNKLAQESTIREQIEKNTDDEGDDSTEEGEEANSEADNQSSQNQYHKKVRDNENLTKRLANQKALSWSAHDRKSTPPPWLQNQDKDSPSQVSPSSADYWRKASALNSSTQPGDEGPDSSKSKIDVDDLLGLGHEEEQETLLQAAQTLNRPPQFPGNSYDTASTSTLFSLDQDAEESHTDLASKGYSTINQSGSGDEESLINVTEDNKVNDNTLLLAGLSLGDVQKQNGTNLTEDSEFGPFTDFSSDDTLLKDDDEDFDFTGKILEAAAKNKEVYKTKEVQKPAGGKQIDLLADGLGQGDDYSPEEVDKDDMSLLNEILNAPSTGEDEFTTEWDAVFGGAPSSLTPDAAQEESGFLPSSLLDTQLTAGTMDAGSGFGDFTGSGLDDFSMFGTGADLLSLKQTQTAAATPEPVGATQKKGAKSKPQLTTKGAAPQTTDMSAWFNLFADLDPLSNPDAVGKKPDDMTDACF